jgi:hypothetical protein
MEKIYRSKNDHTSVRCYPNELRIIAEYNDAWNHDSVGLFFKDIKEYKKNS